jgi:6-phosphogluconate dehydrogenase
MVTATSMQLGMVGLGRMGAGIVRRLLRDGHECVGYNRTPDAVAALAAEGMVGATSIEDFASKLSPPRVTWVMVPAGDITENVISALADVLEPGDVIIDGGNTHYHDDIRRAAELAEKDPPCRCRQSGECGPERGFCLMIGGERGCRAIDPPSAPRARRDAAPRPGAPETPARQNTATTTAA